MVRLAKGVYCDELTPVEVQVSGSPTSGTKCGTAYSRAKPRERRRRITVRPIWRSYNQETRSAESHCRDKLRLMFSAHTQSIE